MYIVDYKIFISVIIIYSSSVAGSDKIEHNCGATLIGKIFFFKHDFHGVKGTGTRDYNWLKVVWHDGSWLGESPADIQQIFNCPFKFILN